MKRQLYGLQNRFAVFSLFAPSVMQLPFACHGKSSQLDGLDGRNFVRSLHPKNISLFFCATGERNQNDVCETAVYKEKSKDVISYSKDNFFFVQTSYMFWLCIDIIRLNIAP